MNTVIDTEVIIGSLTEVLSPGPTKSPEPFRSLVLAKCALRVVAMTTRFKNKGGAIAK
jgi:hypothetical protein